MESKWYFFPGQTIENTSISDRAHALHISSEAWKDITQHLDRKKRIQEAIAKEKAHREALRIGSEAMTKEWPNSINNIHLKKEKERRQRIERKNEDKIQMFYKMRAEQEAVRKEYVEKIRKDIFKSTGHPKELTSALILSETLYEREKQKEFNEQIKKHEDELKKKYEQEVIASDEKQRQEDKEKKLKKMERERIVAQKLQDQIKENEERRKAAIRAHVEKETQDNIKAAIEQELIKECEIEKKKKKQREMALAKKKAIEAEDKRQEILRKEEEEMEKATEFYSEAKKRIDCMLKQKAKEMKEEAIRHHEAMALKAAAVQEVKDTAEDARIAKVIAERDQKEKEKIEAKAAAQAKAVKDRIEDRKKHLERLENERRSDEEMKRWEMLNRYKTAEVVKDYEERNRRQKWAKMLEYRRDLLEQMADDKETIKRELEIDEIMNRVSFEEADKMFFQYADEVLQLAKRKNRLIYPIEKVITEYKKINNLLPKNRKCRCCKKQH